MVWTCPTSGTNSANALAILSTQTNFFNWMQSPAKATCKTVSPSDVYTAMQNRGSGNNSTQISTLSAQVVAAAAQLKTKMDDANIAKDRAAMSQRPELTASYYDSWFPLNRPMKRSAVIFLLGIATFFLVLSLFLLMNVIGIESAFRISVPFDTTGETNSRPILILSGIIVVLVGVIIYAFKR